MTLIETLVYAFLFSIGTTSLYTSLLVMIMIGRINKKIKEQEEKKLRDVFSYKNELEGGLFVRSPETAIAEERGVIKSINFEEDVLTIRTTVPFKYGNDYARDNEIKEVEKCSLYTFRKNRDRKIIKTENGFSFFNKNRKEEEVSIVSRKHMEKINSYLVTTRRNLRGQ